MGSITLAIIEEEPAVMQISIIIKHYTEHYTKWWGHAGLYNAGYHDNITIRFCVSRGRLQRLKMYSYYVCSLFSYTCVQYF